MRALSLSGALAMLLLSQSVPAAFMTFSDRTTFEAELGSLVIDDYSNAGYVFLQSDVVMSNVLGETEYTSTGFVDWNLIPGEYYCAGCNGSFELAFTTTSVGNATGVFGVGFEFFNAVSPQYVAYVTFGNAATTNIPLPSAPSNFSSGAFFGITASELVTSIHLGLPNGGTTTSGSFGIDNLTIGSSAVPEPATILLLGLGLTGFGIARRCTQLTSRLQLVRPWPTERVRWQSTAFGNRRSRRWSIHPMRP